MPALQLFNRHYTPTQKPTQKPTRSRSQRTKSRKTSLPSPADDVCKRRAEGGGAIPDMAVLIGFRSSAGSPGIRKKLVSVPISRPVSHRREPHRPEGIRWRGRRTFCRLLQFMRKTRSLNLMARLESTLWAARLVSLELGRAIGVCYG